MTITIPFHGSANLSAQINRIEFVRRPDGDVVCLCIDCSRPDEMTLWEALKIKNRNIDISMS